MLPLLQILRLSKRLITNPVHAQAKQKSVDESSKSPLRHELINFLLAQVNRETTYLEIGVCKPKLNFDKIIASQKYGVDPGVEFEENPVDFQMTSDAFFEQLKQDKVLSSSIKFDVIFIDGLHCATQVEKDIENALGFLKEEGFLVLHDCNPPTEYHAREDRLYTLSPALRSWNGTTWKAFYKCRLNPSLSCCCIDSDWGIGIITRKKYFSHLEQDMNPYFEFAVFEENRKEILNLLSFEEFEETLKFSH